MIDYNKDFLCLSNLFPSGARRRGERKREREMKAARKGGSGCNAVRTTWTLTSTKWTEPIKASLSSTLGHARLQHRRRRRGWLLSHATDAIPVGTTHVATWYVPYVAHAAHGGVPILLGLRACSSDPATLTACGFLPYRTYVVLVLRTRKAAIEDWRALLSTFSAYSCVAAAVL